MRERDLIVSGTIKRRERKKIPITHLWQNRCSSPLSNRCRIRNRPHRRSKLGSDIRDDGTGEAEFAAPHNDNAFVIAEFARAAADELGGGGGVGLGYFEAPITPQQMGGIEFD